MQELFALQRWRRISILKEYSSSASSGSSNSRNAYSARDSSLSGGLEGRKRRGLNEGATHSTVQHQSTAQNTSHTHALTSALMNVRTNTGQGTVSGSVDRMFNRHLYGGGVLSSVEVNYFITHLSTPASISTSKSMSGGMDSLFSFFIGSEVGCEVGDLYSFHDELACHVSNRAKQKAVADKNRLGAKRDRHTDYHSALNDTQGNGRYVYNDFYSDNESTGSDLSFAASSAMHLSNYGVLCVRADSDVRDVEGVEGVKEVAMGEGSAREGDHPVHHSSQFIDQYKARTSSITTALSVPNSTAHRQLQHQLETEIQNGCPVVDLMPLSVQLGLLVTQPLHAAKATELYAAVTTLREKHMLGRHFKCEICLFL